MKNEVIQKLIDREMTLSYTAMSELLVSPKAFMEYKTGEKEATKAMDAGTLFHSLVLEPETIDDKFIIFRKPIPTSNMNKTENKMAWEKAVANAEKTGKILIEEKTYLEEKANADLLLNNKITSQFLDFKEDVEIKIKLDYKGWTIRGMIDLKTKFNRELALADLKKMPDADPKKVMWESRRRKLEIQGFVYNYWLSGQNEDRAVWLPYYLIVCDSKSVSVHRFDPDTITNGKVLLDKAIDGLEELIFLSEVDGPHVWDQDREFWAPNKQYYNF